MLFSNKGYIFIFIGISFSLGFYNVIGTILSEVLKRYNIDENINAFIGGTGSFIGLSSTVLFSLYVGKYKNFQKLIMIFISIAIFAQILFTIFLNFLPNILFFELFSWSLVCIGVFPVFMIGLDYACELSYPVGESLSVGLIFTFSQIVGIAFVKYLIKLDFVE